MTAPAFDIKPEAPRRTAEYVIRCGGEGCFEEVRASITAKHNVEAKARIRARVTAREAKWNLTGFGDKKQWFCEACMILKDQTEAEAEFSDRTEGAAKRLLLRASARVREAVERRQASQDASERRKTRKVGKDVAAADTTLTRDTERLIAGNNFDRYILPKLLPRQVTAADEWRVCLERSQGVSDREELGTRVDGGSGDFGPTIAQIDACRWRAKVQASIGRENVRILDLAIEEDFTSQRIGAKFAMTVDPKKRAIIGIAFIRAALSQLADFMGLRA